MSIAEDTEVAQRLTYLRDECIALRNALARTMAERDQYRDQCQRDSQRAADLIRRLRLTLSEWEQFK